MGLKVGDTIYEFDENRRVYRDDRSGPVFREHFSAHVISGETKFSWLVECYGRDRKINKKTMMESQGPYNPMPWYTETEMSDKIWRHENGREIARKVERHYDLTIDQLKRIKAILEEPQPTDGGGK